MVGKRYRRRRLGTKALEKVLRHHDPWCSTHTVEGNGRCSCGRNQAIAELRVLVRELAKRGYPCQSFSERQRSKRIPALLGP